MTTLKRTVVRLAYAVQRIEYIDQIQRQSIDCASFERKYSNVVAASLLFLILADISFTANQRLLGTFA